MPCSRGECRLRSIRGAKGLSQAELGRRTGYTRQMIHKFEHSIRLMSPEAMYVIARVLGCQMEDLYEWVRVDSAECRLFSALPREICRPIGIRTLVCGFHCKYFQ